jgi:hypothetical protein
MTAPAAESDRARFRRTLIRVLTVQTITLLLLGALQLAFSS